MSKRTLDDDERVLWATFTKPIKPLRGIRIEPVTSAPPAAKTPGKLLKPAKKPAPPSPPPKPQKPSAPPLAQLDRRAKQRIARGQTAIDGRIDLHGLTQGEAHDALAGFIANAARREARLVLVITGKGKGGETGVLRRQVPQWLSLPDFREHIIGFETAAVAHGGEGALYVRIRRRRAGR